jgi:hypothetical protein
MSEDSAEREARRQFVSRCGRFAAITPPAMTMLLAVASKPNQAHASGYRRPWRGDNNDQGPNQQ